MPQIYISGRELEGLTGHEAGRALLSQLYAQHVGGALPQIEIAPGGKPCFVDSPWHFSITHTPRHAFCALSDAPVGIDAEELDREIRLELAEKILSQQELAQFYASADPRKTLLTFWVLKEAQGKKTGKGVGFHPRHTDFTLPDSRVTERCGCLLAVII